MSFWPDWNSLSSVKTWHAVFEIAGIVVLALLVGTEVLAYKFGKRQEILAEEAESGRVAADQRRYDEAEARRKAEVESLQKRVAEADKKAAEAQKRQAQRHLSPEQQQALIAALSPFRGQKVDITSVMGDGDADIFKGDFVSVLERAGWDHNGNDGISQSVIMPTPSGVQVTMNEAEARAGRVLNSAGIFVETLHRLGIISTPTIFVSNGVPVGQIQLVIGNRERP